MRHEGFHRSSIEPSGLKPHTETKDKILASFHGISQLNKGQARDDSSVLSHLGLCEKLKHIEKNGVGEDIMRKGTEKEKSKYNNSNNNFAENSPKCRHRGCLHMTNGASPLPTHHGGEGDLT